jgi:hypothetical protein
MMRGAELAAAALGVDPGTPRLLQPIDLVLILINRAMVTLGKFALLVASAVLTYSVVSRYLVKLFTDWQDEAAVSCSTWAPPLSVPCGLMAAGMTLLLICIFPGIATALPDAVMGLPTVRS